MSEQDAGLQALAWGARLRVGFMLVDAQVSSMKAASWDRGRSGQRSALSASLRCPGSPASQNGLTSLQIIRRRSKKHHGVSMPANTPVLARSARISFSVNYGVPSGKPTISRACASMPAIRRFSAERSRCDRTRLLPSCWPNGDNPEQSCQPPPSNAQHLPHRPQTSNGQNVMAIRGLFA